MGIVTPPPGFNNYGRPNEQIFEHYSGVNWHTGENIWRKVVDLGALPDADIKLVPHGISGLKQMIGIRGSAYRAATQRMLPLPYVSRLPSRGIILTTTATDVIIDTGNADRSAFVGNVVLTYLKN